MKSKYVLAIFVAIALAASAAEAQQKGKGASGASQGGPAQHQPQRPEQCAGCTSPGMSQQGAGRQMRDEDIYGYPLMTERERNEFREQMQNATSDAERQQLAAQHRDEIQARAKQRGIPMRDEEIYGYRLMTERERNEFRQQMQNAASDAERQQLSAQHREEMQSRAKQKGVALEELEEGSK